MRWRALREEDLPDCFLLSEGHMGEGLLGRERAAACWKKLVKHSSFRSAVVFAEDTPGERGLAYGASVFVKSSFADAELANPTAGLNSRVIASLEGGNSVVLESSELARVNGEGDMRVVVLLARLRPETEMEQLQEAAMQTTLSFIELHRGYRIKQLLAELMDEPDRLAYESTGAYRVVKRFGTFEGNNGETNWTGGSTLAIATRESSFATPGSRGPEVFCIDHPVLGLRPSEQELGLEALEADTDEVLAERLHITVFAVKKRWASMMEKAQQELPHLFPEEPGEGKRGRQKRHHLLAYLRKHPEELRPYTAPGKGSLRTG